MKKIFKNQYEYTIISPGGNTQMLIKGIVPKKKKRFINDKMIERFPYVEQVSFYEYDSESKNAILELAGGEFCGSATRSLAYLLLNGKKGEISVQVSGTIQRLKTGVKKKNTAYAQMPVRNRAIKRLRDGLFRVDLEGITQLVCLDPISSNPKKLKLIAWKILKQEDLIYSVPAAGVMFVKDNSNYIDLKPVVWVRDIETILYETACASGTAAIGIWKATQDKKDKTTVKVLQPSGAIIEAIVNKNPFEVYIDGPIEILSKGGEKYENRRK